MVFHVSALKASQWNDTAASKLKSLKDFYDIETE
jgi:hypothetical protein